jgi:UDP-N-acetylmuramoyl-tripeptide--D-alanyl-D-alanine ligase
VPVHVEFFPSVEAVVEEKAALIDCLRSGRLPAGRQGTLLLFADDERTVGLQHRLPAPDARILLWGFGERAEVRGSNFEIVRASNGVPLGMRGTILTNGVGIPVELMGAVGAHAFLPLIAASAVGAALNFETEVVAEGLRGYQPPQGRMRLLPGIKDTLVIDDTYNASPAATTAALETLALLTPTGGRRIAALGDMLELGRASTQEHRKVGVVAAKTCDLLITVGFRARDIAQAALDAGMAEQNILQYEDSTKAGQELQNILHAGDVVLCKGSQSIRMERAVEDIMQEPQRAGELLVRQDEEWKKR